MPVKAAMDRARRDARQGKSPSTQAGEFVKAEMRRFHEGKGTIRSARQAVAVGLSEARRFGVKLSAPKGDGAMRRKARRDLDIGQGRAHPARSRSRGAKKAARTPARRRAA